MNHLVCNMQCGARNADGHIKVFALLQLPFKFWCSNYCGHLIPAANVWVHMKEMFVLTNFKPQSKVENTIVCGKLNKENAEQSRLLTIKT